MSHQLEGTKTARFSAVAAATFTAPRKIRCAISLQSKIASEWRFSLRLKRTKLIPAAEVSAIQE